MQKEGEEDHGKDRKGQQDARHEQPCEDPSVEAKMHEPKDDKDELEQRKNDEHRNEHALQRAYVVDRNLDHRDEEQHHRNAYVLGRPGVIAFLVVGIR